MSVQLVASPSWPVSSFPYTGSSRMNVPAGTTGAAPGVPISAMICGHPNRGGTGAGPGTPVTTVMNSAWLAVIELKSMTVTVNPDVAADADGVPEMSPVPAPITSPSGSAPAVIPYVSGAAPPVTAICCEYATPV